MIKGLKMGRLSVLSGGRVLNSVTCIILRGRWEDLIIHKKTESDDAVKMKTEIGVR